MNDVTGLGEGVKEFVRKSTQALWEGIENKLKLSDVISDDHLPLTFKIVTSLYMWHKSVTTIRDFDKITYDSKEKFVDCSKSPMDR